MTAVKSENYCGRCFDLPQWGGYIECGDFSERCRLARKSPFFIHDKKSTSVLRPFTCVFTHFVQK